MRKYQQLRLLYISPSTSRLSAYKCILFLFFSIYTEQGNAYIFPYTQFKVLLIYYTRNEIIYFLIWNYSRNSEIFNKLKLLYNITNSSESIIPTQKDKSSFNEEIIKFKYNIKKSLAIDSIHIYIYDPNSDLLILKGENEEIKYSKDKDLIGKCFMSGKPIKYLYNEDNSIKSVNKDDCIFIYPINDFENNIYGVIEAINNNSNNSNLEKNYILDKKIELLMSFISKAIGSMCIYYNYIK